MDVGLLTAFLAPFLPVLLKAGETAAEEVGARFGQDAWSHAQRLWDRLWPSVKSKPAALEAANDVAAQPDDDRLIALKVQLEKLLDADHGLSRDVERLFAEADDANVVVAVIGERAVGAGRDIRDSTIVTGDNVDIG
jgi:hypothetical protein